MTRDLYCPPDFYIHKQVHDALVEDFGHGFDLTSQTVLPKNTKATVHMVARQDLILCGLAWGRIALELVDKNLKIEYHKNDSDFCFAKTVLATISGDARSVMSAERVMLNFIGHLSGISTLTYAYADKIKHTQARVTCTRKTLPNLRVAQKYAVRCGGGYSHRSGLDDAILIKDNHIGVCGSVENALNNARCSVGHTTKIQIECDNFQQYQSALQNKADIIMLDNMTLEQLKECVAYEQDKRIAAGIVLEASGGVNLNTIKEIAETGVDIISVGALTHSASNSDIAFDFAFLG